MDDVDVGSATEALPLNHSWGRRAEGASERAAPGWIEMVDELRSLQDVVAASVPSRDAVARARDLMAEARSLLEPYEVGDAEQVFGRLLHRPDRGQTLSPALHVLAHGTNHLEGWVRFTAYHAGSGGAVHGGVLALLFDDALGRLADLGDRSASRTASLKVDYRNITPVGIRLRVVATMESEEGRKRWLRGSLADEHGICAEAEGLFVALRPGQP